MMSLSNLVYIEGIVDKNFNRNILEDHLLHYARKMLPREWIFRQGIHPKHTFKMVVHWFTGISADFLIFKEPAASKPNYSSHNQSQPVITISHHQFQSQPGLYF